MNHIYGGGGGGGMPYASPAPSMGYAPPSVQPAMQQPPAPSHSPAPPSSPNTQIGPGAITYTTSRDANGTLVYNTFKAVPASYVTPQGVVNGIQWVPLEATATIPYGAKPADQEFAASWARGNLSPDDAKAVDKWQKAEAKRLRKEEKKAARVREKEEERRRRHEMDARGGYMQPSPYGGSSPLPGGGIHDVTRGMGNMAINTQQPSDLGRPRKYSGYAPPSPYSTAAPGGYPSSGAYPQTQGTVYPSSPGGRPKSIYGDSKPATAYPSSPRPGGDIYGRPLSRAPSPAPYAAAAPTAAAYPSSPRPAVYANPNSRAPSPNPYGNPNSAVYPRGHILEGQSQAAGGQPPAYGSQMPAPRSRAPSPNPGMYTAPTSNPYPAATSNPYATAASNPYGAPTSNPYGAATSSPYAAPHAAAGPVPSPRVGAAQLNYPPTAYQASTPGYTASPSTPAPPTMPPAGASYRDGAIPAPQQAPDMTQLTTPEAFSRPKNMALPYTPFDPLKTQDMDEFAYVLPKMPMVMQTHDVYYDDWIRLMTDLSLAWTGKLPVPEYSHGGRAPKRSDLCADLLELWNNSFFLTRGVELVLFKGHVRRSGPYAGTIERHLPLSDEEREEEVSSDSSSESESEDDSDLSEDDRYGRYGEAEARRRRREKKAEKKRRHRERKLRKKEKEREKRYALYVFSVSQQM